MTENNARRVAAQAGWIVDLPYPDSSDQRARFAVVEWEYDPDEQTTKALCMGPLGSAFEDTIGLVNIDITAGGGDVLVRYAPEQLNDRPFG